MMGDVAEVAQRGAEPADLHIGVGPPAALHALQKILLVRLRRALECRPYAAVLRVNSPVFANHQRGFGTVEGNAVANSFDRPMLSETAELVHQHEVAVVVID